MVDLVMTPDQEQIVDAFGDVLTGDSPVEAVRDRGAAGVRSAEWLAKLGELGWLAVGVPEQGGGAGLGLVEEVLLAREAGRHLLTPSFIASLAAVHATNDPELATGIMTGARRVGLAVPRAEEGATRSVLVFEAGSGDVVLLSDINDVRLFRYDDLTGAVPVASIDETLMASRGDLALNRSMSAQAEAKSLARRTALLAAGMLVGGAQAALKMAIGHATTRRQFGQAIGAFQGVKHACADMAVRAEAASAQLLFAALAVVERRADADFQVSAAKMLAGEAAILNAEQNIQIHGAMGFTAESEAHLYLKRAHVLGAVGGSSRKHSMALVALSPA